MNKTYNPFIHIIKSFEGFIHSDIYYKLRKQTTGSKLLAALIVAFLITLFSFGVRTFNLCTNKNVESFINRLPDFSYEDNKLFVAEKFENSTDDSYLLIDTNISYFYNGSDDGRNNYSNPVDVAPLIKNVNTNNSITQGLFVSESNLVMVNFITGQIQHMTFKELSSMLHIPSFSKDSIQAGYKSFIVKWAVILGLLYLPVRYALLFLTALIFCLLAQIGRSITKSNDDFNTIYWIAFYINIAFVIIKTLLVTLLPLGGSMLNTLFFALFMLLILKTLKAGDPDAEKASTRTISYPGMTAYDTFTGSNAAFIGNDSAFGSDTQKQTVDTVIEDDLENFENNNPL